MTRMKLLSPLFLLPLITSCVANEDGSPTEPPSAEQANAPAADHVGQGDIVFTANTDEKVAGHFTKDGTTIGFDLEKQGEVMHVVVTSADGTPLIDSDVGHDGVHTTRMLGARLVVTGTGDAEPTYAGDRKAERALHEMPEGDLINALEPALMDARINPNMLPTMQITGKVPSAVGYGNCNTFVPDGGYASCGSVFLGWTSIRVQNCSSYYASYLITSALDGTAGAPGQGFYNMGPGNPWYCPSDDHSGWWWGSNVTLKWGSHYYWASWIPTQVGGQSLYFGH